jgi:hypothetical protein
MKNIKSKIHLMVQRIGYNSLHNLDYITTWEQYFLIKDKV